MMPPGHLAVTWGVASLLQKNNRRLARLDYRLLAFCALLPDFIDKPLAVLVFTRSHSSQNVTHSLSFHLLLLGLALLGWRRAVPYVLAANGHLLADRMWHHTETFWWPLFGWNVFWQYKPMNTPAAMLQEYLNIITRYPQVWLVEALALAMLLRFVFRRRLYHWPRLETFIRTGHLPAERETAFAQKVKKPLPTTQKSV
jgi:hypothetical protein